MFPALHLSRFFVCVMNTPGQNSNAVAELAFGMMVMAVRNMYNGTSGTELKGKKLGIHAYGNVGRNVARIAKGFGMEIFAFDAFCPKEVIEKDGVKAVDSADELYSACDVVSLHIPATAETKNSINYALVNKMPKGGVWSIHRCRFHRSCEIRSKDFILYLRYKT